MRVGGVAGLLEATGPTLIVGRGQVEQKRVAVVVPQKVGMVAERLFGIVVTAEALVLEVVVVPEGGAASAAAFDSEVIVGLDG